MSLTPEQCDEQDLAELPREIADRAIARWNEALREQAEAYRLAGDDGGLESWTDLTTLTAINAGRVLIRAILAYGPDYDGPRRFKAEKRRWEPRGIRSHGKLYLTFPIEGSSGEPEKLDGPDVMMLVVVAESSIVDIERDEVPATPSPKPGASRLPGLTQAEESVLFFVRNLGEREAMDRLYLAGPYGAIAGAIDRLGTDAVAELRRQIEAGKLAS